MTLTVAPEATWETLEEPKFKTGAEVIASWERKGVLGKVFMHSPEDAPELARILRAETDQRVMNEYNGRRFMH